MTSGGVGTGIPYLQLIRINLEVRDDSTFWVQYLVAFTYLFQRAHSRFT